MAKKLGFIVILSMCLLIVEFAHAQEEFPSPALSPERETVTDSHLPPSSSPESDFSLSPESDSSLSPESDSSLSPASSPKTDSIPPPASTSKPESPADSPPSSPPHPESLSPSPSPFPLSPGPAPVPVPAPSDDDDDSDDDDADQETEYFPSPAPSPASEIGIADDIKASEDGDEFKEVQGEDGGMSGSKKAGIAIGAILGVGSIVMGALVYKKRRENLTRARYTYFNQEEFL